MLGGVLPQEAQFFAAHLLLTKVLLRAHGCDCARPVWALTHCRTHCQVRTQWRALAAEQQAALRSRLVALLSEHMARGGGEHVWRRLALVVAAAAGATPGGCSEWAVAVLRQAEAEPHRAERAAALLLALVEEAVQRTHACRQAAELELHALGPAMLDLCASLLAQPAPCGAAARRDALHLVSACLALARAGSVAHGAPPLSVAALEAARVPLLPLLLHAALHTEAAVLASPPVRAGPAAEVQLAGVEAVEALLQAAKPSAARRGGSSGDSRERAAERDSIARLAAAVATSAAEQRSLLQRGSALAAEHAAASGLLLPDGDLACVRWCRGAARVAAAVAREHVQRLAAAEEAAWPQLCMLLVAGVAHSDLVVSDTCLQPWLR